jgi:hypothetical protein
MAGGIDWFRWHHGSVTDPKFALIARKAKVRLGDVIAVWAYLLEQASASTERGSYGSIDCEALDCLLGTGDGTADAILTAMCDRGLVNPESDTIVSWEKRQPKREDETAAERKRRQREREHELAVTSSASRDVTQGHDREEERRGEKKEETSNLAVAPAQPPVEQPVLALVASPPPKPKGPPDCPHQAVLELWAEVLPHLPQHLPSQWRGTRADHLRARWRETAVEKGWTDQAQGLAYLRKFFGFVGQSMFLTGKSPPRGDKRPFVIELEWLVNPTNWAKVHEGKYHQESA